HLAELPLGQAFVGLPAAGGDGVADARRDALAQGRGDLDDPEIEVAREALFLHLGSTLHLCVPLLAARPPSRPGTGRGGREGTVQRIRSLPSVWRTFSI